MTQSAPRRARVACALGVGVAVSLSFVSPARADESKRACVNASTEGQTLRQEDKLLEAREKLHLCANDPCPDLVKSHCTRWLSEIEAQIPSVIVRATDASGADVLDADVSVDGRLVKLGRPEILDPGEHTVTVTRATGDKREEKFLLVDGERARVLAIHFPAAPAAAPPAAGAPPSPPPANDGADEHGHGIPAGAWVIGALGVAGLGVAAGFYIQSSSDYNALTAPGACAPHCTDAQTQNLRTHVTIADISLGVGVAGIVGATIWAIVAVTRPHQSSHTASSSVPLFDVRPVAGGAVTSLAVRF